MQLVALFRLAFASAPDLKSLTLPRIITRRTVLHKVRRRTDRAPTACKHRVSGSLSLPSRGSFHLSLTVLCAIGHHIVFRLGGWSPRLPAGFLVSCGTLVSACRVCLSSTRLSLSLAALSNALPLDFHVRSADPQPQRACSLVWPLSRSLAAT